MLTTQTPVPSKPEIKTKREKQHNNLGLVATLVVFLVLLAAFAFGYRYFLKQIQSNPELIDFNKSLQDLRAAISVDSLRLHSIQKVMKIISSYNPEMPSGTKYEIAEEIYNLSLNYTNLDIDLICATITHETGSTWEPEIISETGAIGLMQVMPATSIWVAHYEGITWTAPQEVLFNPIYNIRIGCRQLSTYIEMYDLEGGLAAYNGGEKRAAIWMNNNKAKGILWAETSNYIPHVLRLYDEFKAVTL